MLITKQRKEIRFMRHKLDNQRLEVCNVMTDLEPKARHETYKTFQRLFRLSSDSLQPPFRHSIQPSIIKQLSTDKGINPYVSSPPLCIFSSSFSSLLPKSCLKAFNNIWCLLDSILNSFFLSSLSWSQSSFFSLCFPWFLPWRMNDAKVDVYPEMCSSLLMSLPCFLLKFMFISLQPRDEKRVLAILFPKKSFSCKTLPNERTNVALKST